MTTPINNLNKVLDTLKRQMAGRSGKTTAKSGADNASQASTVHSAQSSPLQRAQERIVALDPQDPAFEHKARRIFLQTVFADEFGDTVANESAFYQLIEDVEHLIDEDEKLQKVFTELFRRLVQRT